MPELNLNFLGPVQITHQHLREITFANRKALALLAYLAVELDHPHSRESLMGLLWPELPTASAQNNLRVTWAYLRKNLWDTQERAHPFLIATRLELQFNQQSDHTLDLRLFQNLLDACNAHPHLNRSGCPECAGRLTQALELARGNFLEGFSLGDCPTFDEWVFMQRERLYRQTTAALEDLADFHENAGHQKEANKYVLRQLEFDPLRESAHRQRMRLLAGMGQRSAALDQYETCRRLLANELGVAPAPETILLVEQIRSLAPTQIDTPRHNLPPSLTRFIGRSEESSSLQERLTHESGGIVTLVGPGGVGKTRLSLQVAHDLTHHFVDGVWLIELAGVVDASAVPATAAASLNITPDARHSPTHLIGDYLRDKSILLILDNCEHLLEACTQLVKALRLAAPKVTVLTTSRTPLHLEDEQVVRLKPFPSPETEPSQLLTAADALEFAAIQLFAHRAAQSLLSFSINDSNASVVAQICRNLDGIPLAIELAAARAGSMTVEAIAERLHQRFRWRSAQKSSLSRQRTLNALIDWSYSLLDEQERSLFCRLAVFAGSWTLEAAEAVSEDEDACAEILGRLVDQSLVVFGEDSESKRYHMHETIRQFAANKLSELGKEITTVVYKQHSQFFSEFIANHSDALWGKKPHLTVLKIQPDIENLRQAWQWAVTHQAWILLETAMTGFSRFLFTTGRYQEGEQLYREALHVLETNATANQEKLEAELQIELASILCRVGQLDEGIALVQEAANWATCQEKTLLAARAYLEWGYGTEQKTGNYQETQALLQQGIDWAQKGNHRAAWAKILRYQAYYQLRSSHPQEGESGLKQALSIQEQFGNVMEQQWLLLQLGISRLGDYDYMQARRYLEKSLTLQTEVGHPGVESRVANALGFTEAALGNFQAALPLHEKAYQLAREIGERVQMIMVTTNLVTVNRKMGRLSEAEELAESALRMAQETESLVGMSDSLLHLAYVCLDQNKAQLIPPLAKNILSEYEGDLSFQIEFSAALCETHRQLGQLEIAQSFIEPILPFLLSEQMIGSADEPFQVYLNAYRILQDLNDERAQSLLELAHDYLLTIANKIDDPATKQMYFENVPAHRELLQRWARANASE